MIKLAIFVILKWLKIDFTKFLSKKCESKFPLFPHCAEKKRLENGTSQENIRLNFQLKKTPLRMTLLSTKSHKFRLSVTFFSSQRKQQKRKKTFLFTARKNSKTATVFLQKLREINFFSNDFFVKPCETSNFDEISRKIGNKWIKFRVNSYLMKAKPS